MDIRGTRIFKWWQRYEHHLGVGALVVGFLFDLWLADRPDSLSNNLLLLSYLFVAGALIIILNLREMRKKEGSAEPLFLLLVLQFCFGGLASNLLVIYGRSGTLAGSAVFIGLLVALVLGNEYLRGRYTLLRFNIAMYYFLVLTYCVIAVPTFITHSVGSFSFLFSVAVSVAYIAGFLAVIYVVVLRRAQAPLWRVSSVLAIICAAFMGLYFLRVIPPVPLSLKEIGVYHSLLKRGDGSYLAVYEKAHWWQPWRSTATAYTLSQGGSAFCYSSVFAPGALKAPIYHRWEYRNPATGEWEERSRVSFPISGGRDEGYRGFSVKSNLVPGAWRCDVETTAGALIGRVGFEVVESSKPPALSQTVL